MLEKLKISLRSGAVAHGLRVTWGMTKEFFWPLYTLFIIVLFSFDRNGADYSTKTISVFLLPLFTPVFMFWGALFRISHKEKQSSANERIIDSITGGNSYPLVQVTMVKSGGAEVPYSLMLSIGGNYSVYDLSMSVTNNELFRTALYADGIDMANYIQKHQLGTLGSGYQVRLNSLADGNTQTFFRPSDGRLSFHISSVARNGLFSQTLLARRVGPRWFTATRVLHHRFGVNSKLDKMIFEFIDPDFPEDQLTSLQPQIIA